MEENFNQNYYKILNIKYTANKEEIRRAYRMLAIKNHPDKGGLEEKMKVINEAYNVLSTEEMKEKYDKWYREKYFTKPISTPIYTTQVEYKKENKIKNKNLYELELTPKLIEKIKKYNNSKNVFEVVTYKNPVIIPTFCTCCLEVTEKCNIISCNQSYMGENYTFSLQFPFCPNCCKHKLDFELKTVLIICLSLILSLIFMTIILLLFEINNFIMFLSISIFLAIFWIINLNLVISLKKVENIDMHSDISNVVEIVSFTKEYVRVRFLNYGYAKVFAELNDSKIKAVIKPFKAHNRLSVIKGVRGLKVFAYLIFLIICFSFLIYNIYWQILQ